MPTQQMQRDALYYPFHLCHEHTLKRLLEEYRVVHFRDFMALQLTPTTGTTAYADRMGNFHPELVRQGRVVQGHAVSGPLDPPMVAAIDRDLADVTWRLVFHDAFRSDRRFQRGLFDLTHGMRIGGTLVPGAAALLELMGDTRAQQPYRVQRVRELTQVSTLTDGYDFEYGWAVLKTAAALWHTIRLCERHGLDAVTDSDPHYRLLQRTCEREAVALANAWLPREGY